MVRISVEVLSGASRFRMRVRAESIERGLELTDARYPSSTVKVIFPIDPEPFFYGSAASGPEIWQEMPETAAG